MKTPDHQTSKLGAKDFVFQANKWPFSITCNPLMPTITESFIDLALVKDMKVAMKKVECRNISYGGLSTKVVGSISQTVQVVYNGVASGTMHLKAKVIRNLTNLYGVDCIASQKLYKILTGTGLSLDSSTGSVATEPTAESAELNSSKLSGESDDDMVFDSRDSPGKRKTKRRNRFMVANVSFTSSMLSSPMASPRSSSPIPDPDEMDNLVFDADDTPQTRKRKRRNRFTASNLSLTSSLASSPSKSRSSSPTARPQQVQSSNAYLTSASPGLPTTTSGQTRQESPPHHLQNPPLHLTDFILCGHAPPCSCVETLRAQQQLQLLPPHYPVYLPSEHQPCGRVCATHRVHGDNLHPPDPYLCSCNPPRLQPGYGPAHIQYVPLLPDQHDEPPLPPDFQPCGNYCGYEICQCLRNYAGRDWAS